MQNILINQWINRQQLERFFYNNSTHCRTFTQPWCTVGTGWFMWSMCSSTSSTSPTAAMPSSPCSLTSCTVQVYRTGSHAPGHKNTLIQTGGWRWGKQSPGQYHWLTNQRSGHVINQRPVTGHETTLCQSWASISGHKKTFLFVVDIAEIRRSRVLDNNWQSTFNICINLINYNL